jgi:hypothetical protein
MIQDKSVQFASFYHYPPLVETEFQRFEQEVDKTVQGANLEQEAQLLALYQATENGKTKLGYSLGFVRYVVMLRNFATLRIPFMGLLNNAREKLSSLKLAPTNSALLSEIFNWNQRMVMLWIISHIDLYELLCKHGTPYIG